MFPTFANDDDHHLTVKRYRYVVVVAEFPGYGSMKMLFAVRGLLVFGFQ